MEYKKNRKMTVAYACGKEDSNIPMIRMQGKWLTNLGFDVGDKINVECRNKQLIITKECKGVSINEQ